MELEFIKSVVKDVIKDSKVEPREYQFRIITSVIDNYINKDLKSILIESPTGSGKTITALLTIKSLEMLLNCRFGWMAHRKFLLSQAISENKKYNINANIVCMSMFQKGAPANLNSLMIDEAVHDSVNSSMHLHNQIRPKYILGASAYPKRTDRVKLCFDKTITDWGIHALIKAGFLSKFHHYTITQKFTPLEIARVYIREIEKWGKSAVYFHTVEECYELQNILKSVGISSEVVTGNTKENVQIQKFKEDSKCNVIINCLKLTEGLDLPILNSVFCRDGSRGPTIQICGRVFRIHPNVNVTNKNVIQSNRTKWPITKTASPDKQFIWDANINGWKGLQPNLNAEIAQRNSLTAISKIEVKLPELFKKKETLRMRSRRNSRLNRGNSE